MICSVTVIFGPWSEYYRQNCFCPVNINQFLLFPFFAVKGDETLPPLPKQQVQSTDLPRNTTENGLALLPPKSPGTRAEGCGALKLNNANVYLRMEGTKDSLHNHLFFLLNSFFCLFAFSFFLFSLLYFFHFILSYFILFCFLLSFSIYFLLFIFYFSFIYFHFYPFC